LEAWRVKCLDGWSSRVYVLNIRKTKVEVNNRNKIDLTVPRTLGQTCRPRTLSELGIGLRLGLWAALAMETGLGAVNWQ
jgi:hypothetical protein